MKRLILTILVFLLVLSSCSTAIPVRDIASSDECITQVSVILKKPIRKKIVTVGQASLQNLAKEAKTDTDLLDLVESLKDSKSSFDEMETMLMLSPRYESLRQENDELAASILYALKGQYKKENANDHFRSALAMIFAEGDELLEAVKETSSKYNFSKAMSRLSKVGKDKNKILTNLEASKFCKYFGCTKEELTAVVARVKKGENVNSVLEDIYPIFKSKKSLRNMNEYDIDLPVVQVKDQCGWDNCWMNAGMERAEAEILAQHGMSIPLSVDHNYIQYISNEEKLRLLRYKALEENYTQNFNIFADRAGLVPESALNLKNKLHDQEVADNLKEALYQIQERFERAEKQLSGAALDSLRKNLFLEIDQLMEETFGKLPQSFLYNGEIHTPQSFAKKYYPSFGKSYGALLAEGKKNNFTSVHFVSVDGVVEKPAQALTQFKNETKKPGDILSYLANEIESKRVVAVDFEWPSSYQYSTDSGLKLFINPKTGEISAPERQSKFVDAYGHAVLVTGVEYDKNGKVSRLKILNSLGVKSGDKGFYHMDRNFFIQHVLCAYKNQ